MSLFLSTFLLYTRIDLAVLLGKTPSSMENDSSNLDPSQAPSLAQPLVFSNSKQSTITQPAPGNSFSHHSVVRRRSGALCLQHIRAVLPSSDRFGLPQSIPFCPLSSLVGRHVELGRNMLCDRRTSFWTD